MRVLVVMSDPDLADRRVAMLSAAGCVAEAVETGEDAVQYAPLMSFQAVVTSETLSDMDGVALAGRIARSRRPLPVVIWTDSVAPDTVAALLAAPVADVCTGYAHVEEVAARLRAAVTRGATPAPLIEAHGVQLDPELRSVHVGDAALRLTRVEARILEVLMAAQGRPVVYEAMIDSLYGYDADADRPLRQTIAVQICYLRRKLRGALRIEAVYGTGYRLAPARGHA